MYLDHLLYEYNVAFGLEEASPCDDGEDDMVDDPADFTQLLHTFTLQMTLQILTVEDLK